MDLGSVWGLAGRGAWTEWRLGGGQAPGSRAPGLSLEPVPTQLPWDGPTRLPRHPSPLIDCLGDYGLGTCVPETSIYRCKGLG